MRGGYPDLIPTLIISFLDMTKKYALILDNYIAEEFKRVMEKY